MDIVCGGDRQILVLFSKKLFSNYILASLVLRPVRVAEGVQNIYHTQFG